MVFCPGSPPDLRHPPLPRPPALLPALVPPDGRGTGVADGVVPAGHWTAPGAGTAAAEGDGVSGGTLAGIDYRMKELAKLVIMVIIAPNEIIAVGCFHWYHYIIQIYIQALFIHGYFFTISFKPLRSSTFRLFSCDKSNRSFIDGRDR